MSHKIGFMNRVSQHTQEHSYTYTCLVKERSNKITSHSLNSTYITTQNYMGGIKLMKDLNNPITFIVPYLTITFRL